MDWILNHLQLVIAIAAAIAYWLNSQRKNAASDATPEDDEEAERTRRIQEEIRRKIAGRRSGQAPTESVAPPRPAPPPLLRPRPSELPMPPFGAPPQPVFSPRTVRDEAGNVEDDGAERARTAAILERQEKLAEEMRALEAARVEARRRAAQVAAAEAETLAQQARDGRGGRALAEELRDAKSVRRAVVLREVLGMPVGLR